MERVEGVIAEVIVGVYTIQVVVEHREVVEEVLIDFDIRLKQGDVSCVGFVIGHFQVEKGDV